ncbi:DUF4825 domain-containing protein [Caproiciproducens galactitolivorans]|uniref:DUF4825 domain-containing protein n=1 Tax=Caproiciproducens galactitolivorans TaxID=642589 RepID=UPI0024099E3C|nr:DUF4825 domain-containing protein [Caproiciproducens galactitolivorans]
MKTRDRIIIALGIIGILFVFATIQIRNKQYQVEKAYAQAQQEVTSHDLQSILPYKNKYMGNAPNNINLFSHLPLSDYPRNYSQNPDTFTFEIHFEGTASGMGKNRLQKEILYSSVAGFALIDNLQSLKYDFTDQCFTVRRKDIEKQYGDLKVLLNESSWHAMQEKLKKTGDVERIFTEVTLRQKKEGMSG